MGKVTTIPELFELPDDALVYVTKGKIKSLYKPKSGSNNRGQWSFQNLVLTDGRNEITVKLKDREELPQAWKNRTIYLLSTQGDKGWHGVKTKDDSYNDKNTRILWVTPSAEIAEAGAYERGGQAGQEAPHEPQDERRGNSGAPDRQNAPAATERGSTTPGNAARDNHMVTVRKAYGRWANMCLMSIQTVQYIAKQSKEVLGYELDSEQTQALIGQCNIAMEKNGTYDMMPTGKMELKSPEGAPKPKPRNGQSTPAPTQRQPEPERREPPPTPPAEDFPVAPQDDDVPF